MPIIEQILGLPLLVALSILKSDGWFDNATTENKRRRVKFHVDDEGSVVLDNITRYDRGPIEDSEELGTDIVFDERLTVPEQRARLTVEQVLAEPGLLAAMVFTVNGNKAPFETFRVHADLIKSMTEDNGLKVSEDHELKVAEDNVFKVTGVNDLKKLYDLALKGFICHLCWYVNAWDTSSDLVVSAIGQDSYVIPEDCQDKFSALAGNIDLFDKYFIYFVRHFVNSDELKQDLERFQLYSSSC
jgi:hypothetical protein